jgi:hypothetical protein
MSTPTPGTEPDDSTLFREVHLSSLETALDRFRACFKAHNDMEPTLRTERTPDGRRRFLLSVHVRTDPRRTNGDATPPL